MRDSPPFLSLVQPPQYSSPTVQSDTSQQTPHQPAMHHNYRDSAQAGMLFPTKLWSSHRTKKSINHVAPCVSDQCLFTTCSEFVYKFLMPCSGLVHVHHLTASLELLYLPCFCQTLIMELTLFSPCHKKNKNNQAGIFPINPRTLFVGNSQSHRKSCRI